MKLFSVSLDHLILRYYLMMGVIVIAGFTGQWWLALLGFPIFMSTILGISFGKEEKQRATGKMVRMQPGTKEMKEAV